MFFWKSFRVILCSLGSENRNSEKKKTRSVLHRVLTLNARDRDSLLCSKNLRLFRVAVSYINNYFVRRDCDGIGVYQKSLCVRLFEISNQSSFKNFRRINFSSNETLHHLNAFFTRSVSNPQSIIKANFIC